MKRTGHSSTLLRLPPVFALVLAACGGTPVSKPRTPEGAGGVRIETVRLQSVPDEIEAPGTVAAVATAQVAARTIGTVLRVAVREGDAVKRGQLLVELDGRELVARRNAAHAALAEASAARQEAERALTAAQVQAEVAGKTYERFVYLREQKSVSPQEFDEVEARHRAAQAALEQARARQEHSAASYERAGAEGRAAEAVAGYARVVAPFDGVVVRRQVEPGSMAAPETPLLVVEDASRYRLEATIDAAAARGLRAGSSARVQLDALPGRSLPGKVAELEAGADPSSHTIRARIDLPKGPGVRSGLFGRAWFRRGERTAIVVPRGAILERGQLRGVYVVDTAAIARLRLVTLGDSVAERVEILSGLGEGDRIVLDPGARELDGKKVEAQR